MEFSKWNKAVPDYDSLQKAVIDIVDKPTNEELNCVELGVGKGGTAHFLFEKFSNLRYTGVDSYEEGVVSCREMFKDKESVNFVVSKIEDYEFTKNLDAVISVLTIHHLTTEDKKDLIKKIYDNLKVGGVCVIGDIFKYEGEEGERLKKERANFRDSILTEEEKELMQKHLDEYPHIFESIDETKDMFFKAGFKEVGMVWENFGMAVLKVVK
jgi:tRNA (cmo5U34)-methyltransferase